MITFKQFLTETNQSETLAMIANELDRILNNQDSSYDLGTKLGKILDIPGVELMTPILHAIKILVKYQHQKFQFAPGSGYARDHTPGFLKHEFNPDQFNTKQRMAFNMVLKAGKMREKLA